MLSSTSIRLEASSAEAGGSSGSESPDAVAFSMDTRGTLSPCSGEAPLDEDLASNAVSGRSRSCVFLPPLSTAFTCPFGWFSAEGVDPRGEDFLRGDTCGCGLTDEVRSSCNGTPLYHCSAAVNGLGVRRFCKLLR